MRSIWRLMIVAVLAFVIGSASTAFYLYVSQQKIATNSTEIEQLKKRVDKQEKEKRSYSVAKPKAAPKPAPKPRKWWKFWERK